MKNRKSNRLKGYDYSQNNLYFVTSCVKNMKCCFGDVVPVGTGRDLSVRDLSVRDLSECDLSALDLHLDIPDRCNPEIDEINAEMILNENGIIANNQFQWVVTQYPYICLHSYVVMPNHIHAVIEIDSNLIKVGPETAQPKEVVKIKPLSQIMGAYKTTTSKLIHERGYEGFAWHRSFHDHIIRNEKSYLNIVNYIENNPNTWFKDKFYNRGD